MYKILILCYFPFLLYAKILPYTIVPSSNKNVQNIKILDAKELRFPDVYELSGLAYKNGKLYALSDKGILYLFNITIDSDKIKNLELQKRYILKNKELQRFAKNKRDAEGLDFYKGNLLVSFEDKERVLEVSLHGEKIKKITLPSVLQKLKNYESKNKGLESVAYSKKYKVITIPELPLKNADSMYHTLYSKHQIWKFKADGAVSDIAFIDEDNLLVLLREFNFFTRRRVTSLVQLSLNACNKQRVCKSKLLASLHSSDGYNIDNFEGLTKIAKNKFLMVSDDNESPFQKTLLVLFEIKN